DRRSVLAARGEGPEAVELHREIEHGGGEGRERDGAAGHGPTAAARARFRDDHALALERDVGRDLPVALVEGDDRHGAAAQRERALEPRLLDRPAERGAAAEGAL